MSNHKEKEEPKDEVKLTKKGDGSEVGMYTEAEQEQMKKAVKEAAEEKKAEEKAEKKEEHKK
jgi:hypothetical protein